MPRPVLLALLAMVPVSLGLRSTHDGERLPDLDRLSADASAILGADGWSVEPPQQHLVGPMVNGSRGSCRILVQFPPPDGQGDKWLRILARPIGPLTYHYRGVTSSEPPRLAPLLSRHAQRYAGSFGLEVATRPLIATAVSPACDSRAPDLTTLRQHLQAARGAA